jgi:Ca2+/H+ antiporter, TMEM165/GDT1 family
MPLESLEALFTSIIAVAIGEIGDKTQLLTLILAARFPKSALPILAGIVIATLANHALAVAFGAWGSTWLSTDILRWVVGISFLVLAVWALIPDEIDRTKVKVAGSAFAATLVAFFVAEMGDKTQVATILLAAKYPDLPLQVILGTTIGMVLANAPAIWVGEHLLKRVPLALVRAIAAGIFATLGVLMLIFGLPKV